MNNPKFTQKSIGVVIAIVFLVGCGAPSTIPTPTATNRAINPTLAGQGANLPGNPPPAGSEVPNEPTAQTAVATNIATSEVAGTPVTWPPGKYNGTFNLNLNCNDIPASGVSYEGILQIKGLVDITIITSKQSKSILDYDSKDHVLKATYHISISQGGMSFTETAILTADPDVLILTPLTDNYDAKKQIFSSPITVSNPQNINYQITFSGTDWDGREKIAKDTTRKYLDAFMKVPTTINLHVQVTQPQLQGDVQMPNLRSACTASGTWQASKNK